MEIQKTAERYLNSTSPCLCKAISIAEKEDSQKVALSLTVVSSNNSEEAVHETALPKGKHIALHIKMKHRDIFNLRTKKRIQTIRVCDLHEAKGIYPICLMLSKGWDL